MKKSFFLILFPIVLSSCGQASISDVLESDKKAIFDVQENQFVDTKEYFSSRIERESKDDKYIFRFSLDDAKMTFHCVRVLLADEEKNTFFFGYNDVSYTLVEESKDMNEKKHIYHGLRISFSLKEEISVMNAYFHSEEKSFFFRVFA